MTSPFVRYAAQQSRFLQHGDARRGCDRSAVVTTAILQIVRRVLTAWLRREHAGMAGVRVEIAALLRDEFNDVARTTLNEIRLEDE